MSSVDYRRHLGGSTGPQEPKTSRRIRRTPDTAKRHSRDAPCAKKNKDIVHETPLRAATAVTIESSTYQELSNYQLKLYRDLYRIRETSVQLQAIEERHPFLRESIERTQIVLLAVQLELQDKLRSNERALQATTTREAT